jgi:tight adherence protein B
LVLGVTAGITVLLLDESSWPRRKWAAYEAMLDYECRFQFIKDWNGRKIARTQLVVGALSIVALVPFVDVEDPFDITLLVAPAVLIAILPVYSLKREHVRRVQQIELQLDSWLLLLANALKATPSLGEAIRASAKIMRAPMGQELDLVLKEMNLGTPLDQAVLSMSNRVGNRTVAGALATILIGRQTGGDMPRILQESAATLREMQRLEGVVRTKTAEGKTQAYVLAIIPFVLIAAIQMIDPNWLRPLTETTGGFIVISVATVLWLGAFFAARKILAVDI